MGTAPKNQIFTAAMLARMREFADANAPTSSAAVAEMLFEEFGVFVYDHQVKYAIHHYGIALGGQKPNPIRSDVKILARIREMVAVDAKACSNPAVVRMIAVEFQVTVTPGQVAAAMNKEGILRGGWRKTIQGQKSLEDIRKTRLAASKAYYARQALLRPRPPEVEKPAPMVSAAAPELVVKKPRFNIQAPVWSEAIEQQRGRTEMLRWAERG